MTNNPKVNPRNQLLNATILILRFLIGGVFLLSGLAKAIDTWGMTIWLPLIGGGLCLLRVYCR